MSSSVFSGKVQYLDRISAARLPYPPEHSRDYNVITCKVLTRSRFFFRSRESSARVAVVSLDLFGTP